jgi:diadenosine tetraphosphate (Ap4A) HIT family hydrolase
MCHLEWMTERGWPEDWQQRKDGHDCPMCASLGAGDNEHTLVIAELPFSEVRLERRSLLPGYCIVVWRFGHVAEPTQLDEDAAAGYWRDVLTAARAIETCFEPMKINLLTLGNWVPHLHTHVVPRYRDDPAPGGPIAYEAMFGQEPIAIDTLKGHVYRIREALPR